MCISLEAFGFSDNSNHNSNFSTLSYKNLILTFLLRCFSLTYATQVMTWVVKMNVHFLFLLAPFFFFSFYFFLPSPCFFLPSFFFISSLILSLLFFLFFFCLSFLNSYLFYPIANFSFLQISSHKYIFLSNSPFK